MYQIKQLPSDFIVNEISSIQAESNGHYAYFVLKKTGLTTVGALGLLSEKFRIPLRYFGFAGNKDKTAITEQKISIFRGSRNLENSSFNNIELKYLGNGKTPISLGDLEGNVFIIVIRNLKGEETKKIQKLQNKKIRIPNLYGPQRFSKNNHLIGKAIVKRDFREAVRLVLENNGIVEKNIEEFLIKNKNNYIEALRLIPLKTRTLFVHSYQSLLFNNITNEFLKIKKTPIQTEIPLIGFDFQISSIKDVQLKRLFKKTVDEEKISPREFIISQMPELTSEGSLRNLFFELKFAVLEIADDELNEGNKKIKINFRLPKSCYATVALGYIFQLS